MKTLNYTCIQFADDRDGDSMNQNKFAIYSMVMDPLSMLATKLCILGTSQKVYEPLEMNSVFNQPTNQPTD